MSFTDTVRDAILTARLVTPTVYLALFNGDPKGAGAEITGNGYAREEITMGAPGAGTGGRRETVNTSEHSLSPTPSDWGTISHLAIMDAPSAGNVLWSQAFSGGSVSVSTTDTLDFAAGSVVAFLKEDS